MDGQRPAHIREHGTNKSGTVEPRPLGLSALRLDRPQRNRGFADAQQCCSRHIWTCSFRPSRKAKFHCRCTIHDLSNLPYVSGLYYAKWRLVAGGSSKGVSHKATVKDHQVFWNTAAEFDVVMVIGKDDSVLQPTPLRISIKQEINGARHSEKVGAIEINLAEAVGQQGLSRRMLLQETKVNSLLRISVEMTLVKGDVSSFKVYVWHLGMDAVGTRRLTIPSNRPASSTRTGFESPLDAVRGDSLERPNVSGANQHLNGYEPVSPRSW
ncbi:N-terminal C2 in EEIG1 and EHBP1 proteins-domain-containing protein [Entophlyctis helioformis]|nr:N-terminal C2 in EEIG1 and EHBP1 proteins-domain-containing protein [Entophlyctis helioformis]